MGARRADAADRRNHRPFGCDPRDRTEGDVRGAHGRFDESIVLLQAQRAPDLNIAYAPVNVAKSSDIAKTPGRPEDRQMVVEANAPTSSSTTTWCARSTQPTAGVRGFAAEYGRDVPRRSAAAIRPPKLALYGLKQRAMLKPTLRLYRGRRTGGVVRALIG